MAGGQSRPLVPSDVCSHHKQPPRVMHCLRRMRTFSPFQVLRLLTSPDHCRAKTKWSGMICQKVFPNEDALFKIKKIYIF